MRWRTANNNRRSKDLRERLRVHGLERLWLKIGDKGDRLPLNVRVAFEGILDDLAKLDDGVALFSATHPAKS